MTNPEANPNTRSGSRRAKRAILPTEGPERDAARGTAKLALEPTVSAASVIAEYGSIFGEQLNLGLLAERLIIDSASIAKGDTKHTERMLYSQAQALQSIFANVIIRATDQQSISAWEAMMRVALKAQNQSRMTLESMAAIKNPPVVYARQANIANGPQQVNNNISPPDATASPRANESKFVQNELLEAPNDQRLDTRATRAAGHIDREVEAVGKVDRTEKRTRQSP